MLCAPMRWALIGLGTVAAVLGVVGVIVPGLPGVVFLLIAVWAFSRSSERLHLWLYTHPRFGKPIRDWHAHRVIPVRAKTAAVLMMAATAVVTLAASPAGSLAPYMVIAALAPVALWIVTRRSRALPVPVSASVSAAEQTTDGLR